MDERVSDMRSLKNELEVTGLRIIKGRWKALSNCEMNRIGKQSLKLEITRCSFRIVGCLKIYGRLRIVGKETIGEKIIRFQISTQVE